MPSLTCQFKNAMIGKENKKINKVMNRSSRRLRRHLQSLKLQLRVAVTKKKEHPVILALKKEIVWVKAQQKMNRSKDYYSPLRKV